jgi:hypothetical protein
MLNRLTTPFFLVVCLMSFGLMQAQQTINISTSNHAEWTVTDPSGATHDVYEVGECVNNDCIMACLCGPTYLTPETPDCGNGHVDAIWGEGPETGEFCDFAAGTYIFTDSFEIEDCLEAHHINWSIIADNHFVLRVNGTTVLANNVLFPTTVGSTTTTNWERQYDISDTQVSWTNYNNGGSGGPVALTDGTNPLNIVDLLQPGTNIIQVEVRNPPVNICANYAFFSMCGTVDLIDVTPDPSFDAAIFPGNDLTLDVTGTTGAGVTHQWLIYEGPTANGPWTVNAGPFVDNGPFPTFYNLNAVSGTHYRIVHRASQNGCAACCEVTLRYDVPRKSATAVRAICGPTDCSAHRWRRETKREAAPAVPQLPSLKLMPNPAEDYLRVESSDAFREVHILDVSGKEVKRKAVEGEATDLRIDLQDLPAGVYFLRTRTLSGQELSSKFIVQKNP